MSTAAEQPQVASGSAPLPHLPAPHGGVLPRKSEQDSKPVDHRPRLMTAKEAIAYLGISLNTLNRIEKRGLIQPFRTPGGHRRYDVSMLDEYLEGSRRGRGRRVPR